MSTMLSDMSTPTLTRVIVLNQIEWMMNFGRSPTAELYESPSLKWWVTCIPHPLLSGVASSRLSKNDLDDTIQSTLSIFKARDVSTFTWWECTGSESRDLAALLIEQNFAYEGGLPGMAVDLMSLPEEVSAPNDLMIKPVEDRERLEDWTSASLAAYGFPET